MVLKHPNVYKHAVFYKQDTRSTHNIEKRTHKRECIGGEFVMCKGLQNSVNR